MYVLHYVVYVYNNKVCSINYKKQICVQCESI